MYKSIRGKLEELKNKKLLAIIDEGRSRKRKEYCMINGIYNRIFTIKTKDSVLSFSYSDFICKTIILNVV